MRHHLGGAAAVSIMRLALLANLAGTALGGYLASSVEVEPQGGIQPGTPRSLVRRERGSTSTDGPHAVPTAAGVDQAVTNATAALEDHTVALKEAPAAADSAVVAERAAQRGAEVSALHNEVEDSDAREVEGGSSTWFRRRRRRRSNHRRRSSRSRRAIAKKVTCSETNYKYSPTDMAGQKRTREGSDTACQKRCSRVSGCAHYSIWPDGGCHLQDGNANKVAAKKVLTGPPTCNQAAVGGAARAIARAVARSAAAKVNCSETDYKYSPTDMAGQKRTKERSEAACQQRCSGVSGCAHYSIWPDGGCHLQDGNANKVAAKKVLTGPPNCSQVAAGRSVRAAAKAAARAVAKASGPPLEAQGTEVHIIMSRTDCLNVAEVVAYTANGTQIAAVNASMDSTHSTRYSAERCIDGSITKYGFCHNKCGKNGWLRVTFDPSADIARVRVHNRGNCCQQRIAGQTIKVYKKGQMALKGTFKGTRTTYTFAVDSDKAKAAGTKVLITMTRKDCLNLREVVAYNADGSKLTASGAYMDMEHSKRYAPAMCIDGDLGRSNFCHNACGANGFLEVMYPLDTDIASVKVFNRGDCCQQRIVGQKIEVFKMGQRIMNGTFRGQRTEYTFATRLATTSTTTSTTTTETTTSTSTTTTTPTTTTTTTAATTTTTTTTVPPPPPPPPKPPPPPPKPPPPPPTAEARAAAPASGGNMSMMQAVSVRMTVVGVNYAGLVANKSLCSDFEKMCQDKIAAQAGVEPSMVTLSLSQGSVVVHATVSVPEKMSAAEMSGKLSTMSLGNSVAAAVATVQGISSVSELSDGGTIAVLTAPTAIVVGADANVTNAENAANATKAPPTSGTRVARRVPWQATTSPKPEKRSVAKPPGNMSAGAPMEAPLDARAGIPKMKEMRQERLERRNASDVNITRPQMPPVVRTTLTSAAAVGSMELQVASPSGFMAGDAIRIRYSPTASLTEADLEGPGDEGEPTNRAILEWKIVKSVDAIQSGGAMLNLTEPLAASFPPSTTVVKVQSGQFALLNGTGSCPQGTELASAEECRAVGIAFGLSSLKMYTVNSSNLPTGCSMRIGQGTVWNRSPQGKAMDEVAPVCRRDLSEAAASASPFNCAVGYENWRQGWSEEKKRYCCKSEEKGCEESPTGAFNCNVGFANWQRGWSEEKKQYCCTVERRVPCEAAPAAPPRLPLAPAMPPVAPRSLPMATVRAIRSAVGAPAPDAPPTGTQSATARARSMGAFNPNGGDSSMGAENATATDVSMGTPSANARDRSMGAFNRHGSMGADNATAGETAQKIRDGSMGAENTTDGSKGAQSATARDRSMGAFNPNDRDGSMGAANAMAKETAQKIRDGSMGAANATATGSSMGTQSATAIARSMGAFNPNGGDGSMGTPSPTATEGSMGAQSATARARSMGAFNPDGGDGPMGVENATATDGPMGAQSATARDRSMGAFNPNGRDGSMGTENAVATDGSMGTQSATAKDRSMGAFNPTGGDGSMGKENATAKEIAQKVRDRSMGAGNATATDGSMGTQSPTATDASMGTQSATARDRSMGAFNPTGGDGPTVSENVTAKETARKIRDGSMGSENATDSMGNLTVGSRLCTPTTVTRTTPKRAGPGHLVFLKRSNSEDVVACKLDSGEAPGVYEHIGVTCCNAFTRTAARPGCKMNLTWDEADKHCKDNGLMLCSKELISEGAGEGTGCEGMNGKSMWTTDECSVDGTATVATPSDTSEPRGSARTRTRRVKPGRSRKRGKMEPEAPAPVPAGPAMQWVWDETGQRQSSAPPVSGWVYIMPPTDKAAGAPAVAPAAVAPAAAPVLSAPAVGEDRGAPGTAAIPAPPDKPRPDDAPYQYYQFEPLQVRNKQKLMEIAEIVLANNGQEVNISDAVVETTSNMVGENGSTLPLLTDGNKSSAWIDQYMEPITIKLKKPESVDGFGFITSAGHPDRDPVKWNFKGSNDGMTWTVLHQQVAEYATTTNRGELQGFVFGEQHPNVFPSEEEKQSEEMASKAAEAGTMESQRIYHTGPYTENLYDNEWTEKDNEVVSKLEGVSMKAMSEAAEQRYQQDSGQAVGSTAGQASNTDGHGEAQSAGQQAEASHGGFLALGGVFAIFLAAAGIYWYYSRGSRRPSQTRPAGAADNDGLIVAGGDARSGAG